MSELKQRTISLSVTENCNLNCIYCYEHNKSNLNMSFETAKKIIDAELKDKRYDGDTYIDFFGGEPFLNFELIKKIYAYVMSFYCGRLRFFTTTNGTLVHDDIQKWLIERRDFFTVGLSLDGTREAHNINRSNSFDKIDLDFFLKHYSDQSVKMTVSKESLPYFAEGIKFLTQKGFKVACNLAYMVDWTSEENRFELEKQLETLIEYYVENPTIPRCQMLDFKIEVLSRPIESERFLKYCGVGTAMKCFTRDGKSYPCHLFAPISAGDKALTTDEIQFCKDYAKENYDKKCRECYYQRICPFCMGSNYISTGNLFKVDESRCKLYKLIYKANAKLKALLWDKGLLTFPDDDEEQALLHSIMTIQSLE